MRVIRIVSSIICLTGQKYHGDQGVLFLFDGCRLFFVEMAFFAVEPGLRDMEGERFGKRTVNGEDGMLPREDEITRRDRGFRGRDEGVTFRDKGITFRDEGITCRDKEITRRYKGVTGRDDGVTLREDEITRRADNLRCRYYRVRHRYEEVTVETGYLKGNGVDNEGVGGRVVALVLLLMKDEVKGI